MSRLSIIVPFLGNVRRLEDTLVSVLENRPERCQIVVVLNQPYDDPYELDGEVRFVEAPLGAGPVDCVDWGIAESNAPIVQVMMAGVEATAGWAEIALPHFADPAVAAVSPVIVDRLDPGRILSAGLQYTRGGAIRRAGRGDRIGNRSCQDGLLGPELVAAFYRKSALESVGLLEDRASATVVGADLALALRSAGFRCIAEPECVTTATLDALAPSSAWQEGMAAERLFWRWTSVTGWKRSLTAHAVQWAVECIQSPIRPSIAARLVGRICSGLRSGNDSRTMQSRQRLEARSEHVIRPPHFATRESRQSFQTRATG